jgi:D-lactate dehydrogenase
MRVTIFSARDFERDPLERANAGAGHELVFVEASLSDQTARIAEGSGAACLFVNDNGSAASLERLHAAGVRLLALRSAGFNHVDLDAADRLGLTVLRVPAYSPHAVAEHTVALMLACNRKIHRAYQRVREQNFELHGLMGFDMHGKTVGVIGTGEIGAVVCRILLGFGCRVVAFDIEPSEECRQMGVEYVALDDLLEQSRIVTLHCPLNPQTKHLIDGEALGRMQDGAMLINTSRGGVVDTRAVIAALKSRRLGALGLDVYEEEADLFFRDLSDEIISDDLFARLTTFPNVLITAHQAFFTREAIDAIAATTIRNITEFERGAPPDANRVTSMLVVRA